MAIPRSEYPRPQFVRPDWLCLNGAWQFEIDPGDSGLARGLRERELTGRITVPFCPESNLSGIANEDFMNAVWYRRTVDIPESYRGKRLLLHFQACDDEAFVWVNGQEVVRHCGGWTPFTADITQAVGDGGQAVIVVRARDDHRELKPMGKQCWRYERYGCLYTRTTGIWQTVWIEPVPMRAHLERTRITPNVGAGVFELEQPLRGDRHGLTYRAILADEAGEIVRAATDAAADFAPRLTLAIPEDRRRLWSPDDPHLYQLRLELIDTDGAIVDAMDSYAGLRSVTIDGMAVKINGKAIFQRLVLDQGYYPDGILTAPSDAAMIEDIKIAMEAGFNGARLHQKVFEERFLYHADRMGYLVWGEFGDWGYNHRGRTHEAPTIRYVHEWIEALQRDYAHPSIVGWCPINESNGPIEDGLTLLDDATRAMFLATKAMDLTRPVIDASGYAHRVRETDIYDSHDYEQDAAKFAERQAGLAEGKPYINGPANRPINIPYNGQPYFVSEFGGIWWNPDAKEGEPSWGYGNRPTSEDEVHERFAGLCDVLLSNPKMFGYCYTQLTDVFQEQNGVVRFDRSRKLDLAKLRAAQTKPAAIEQLQSPRHLASRSTAPIHLTASPHRLTTAGNRPARQSGDA